MTEKRIAAALIDVGGTLWAEHPKHWVDFDSLRMDRLCAAIPSLDHALANKLYREMAARSPLLDEELSLDIRAVISEVARELRVPMQARDIDAIRAAMSVPMGHIAELFDSAREMLETVKKLNLRCIIVSNTMVRNSQEYRRDFQDLGLSQYIDGIITSLDVGFRKPHAAMFEAALVMAECSASQCVFIGNSERNDILPAVSLGMRAIRVAIEEPKPLTSATDTVVSSLAEAAAVLKTWSKGAKR